jgi:NarL family two-component system sensor histidine kinase LiaS
VSNALRHSGTHFLGVDMSCNEGFLEIRITDKGRGFDLSPKNMNPTTNGSSEPLERRRKSNGVANMRQRLTNLGGDVKFESIPGVGTKVIFRLPIKPASRKKS